LAFLSVRSLQALERFAASVIFVFPLFALAGCETRPARAEAATGVTTVWHQLGEWSGRGNRQSDSFDVTTGALQLRWETRGDATAGASRFRVTLHSAISGRPLQVIVDRAGPGSGTAYVEDEPRVSYLVIESDQLEWTAKLEEAVGSTVGAPRKVEPSPP
jgi:hypothetical protein